MLNRNQRTISKDIKFEGLGLHKGNKIKANFRSALPNTGIVFFVNGEKIKVSRDKVNETVLSTTLSGNKEKIHTIEHLMCAISLLGIDNLIIEIDGDEVPIVDGSANPFIILFKEAGLKEFSVPRKFIKIKKSIEVKDNDKSAKIDPYDGFVIDFEIDFEHPYIKSTKQRHVFDADSDSYLKEVSKARTFGFLSDIEYLKKNGLAKGGSLNNAVVLNEFSVVNPEGLRYDNEFVRHKILDAIGDFYIDGLQILGKVTAFKSGHKLNNLLIKEIFSSEENYEIVSLDESNIGNDTIEIYDNDFVLA